MYRDRRDAGQQLAQQLLRYRDADDVVVVGLPRGGVPVALEVATAIGAALDVIVVRKLGVPTQPELAMGAVGEDGVLVVDRDLVGRTGVGEAQLESVIARERAEVEQRAHRFRADRPPVRLAGQTVVVVDDGVATGSTARAACRVAREAGAAHVVLAVPVAPSDWAERLGDAADEYVAVETHWRFGAVGLFYEDFGQTSDGEVVDCLRSADARIRRHERVDASRPPASAGHEPINEGGDR